MNNSIATTIVSVITALGLRELIVMLVKRMERLSDKKEQNNENERNINRQLTSSMLEDMRKDITLLKEEIKERSKVEIDFREKFSYCKAQLDLLYTEVKKYVGDKK